MYCKSYSDIGTVVIVLFTKRTSFFLTLEISTCLPGTLHEDCEPEYVDGKIPLHILKLSD